MKPIRVLASAFVCCPPGKPGFTGGESLLGWQLVHQIARFNEIWVLTNAEDRQSLEEGLAEREAGNIRFGLEMRRLPVGDGGLAIHVLADLAGSQGKSFSEETEIMAFDCFWDGPHYHYGPRNKNHRIYWDKTLITDYLGWVLDKFDGKKLAAMIDRAGYPGVAADLDQDKIDAILPEMTKRAREMEAMGVVATGHPGLPAEVTPNMVRG